MEYQTEIVLGQRYRDVPSGWEGIATGVFFYVNGCTRVNLAGPDKVGQPKDFVFDEEQLVRGDDRGWTLDPPTSRHGGPRSVVPPAR